MAEGFKPCPTCKQRIPKDWPQCGKCYGGWTERDLKSEAQERSANRELLRVRKAQNYQVDPVADEDTLAALQEGIIKRSRERWITQFRKDLAKAHATRQAHINLVERIQAQSEHGT